MSHSSGVVRVGGLCVGYFEYNGTSDIAMPRIYRTFEEVSDNWRDKLGLQPYNEPVCDCEKIPVVLHAHYGNGIEWDSEACLEHMRITGELEPWPIGRDDDKHMPWGV